MTTTVKVEAHCNPDTEMVRVIVPGEDDQVLQDGETTEVTLWDSRSVLVQEVRKPVPVD